MNITERLAEPDMATAKMGQGFSLLRRVRSDKLVAVSKVLSVRRSELIAFGNENGKNRLAMHTMVSGDILRRKLQREVLGDLSLREVVSALVDDVPSLQEPQTLVFESVRVVRATSNGEGDHYLEAVLDEQSAMEHAVEIEAIRASLDSWNYDDAPDFRWADLPMHLALGKMGPETPTATVQEVREATSKLLRPPFQVQLGVSELHLSRH
jgi:hypothetical protein